jgi:hypothetical protein
MKDEIEKILGRALNDKIEAVWNVEDGKVSLESATQDIMALIKDGIPKEKELANITSYSDEGMEIYWRGMGWNAAIDTINTNLGVEDE